MSWERQVHIKNPAEIAIMRQAGRINAAALAATRQLLVPGVSTADLTLLRGAEETRRTSPFKGYGRPLFPASVTSA
jgi:methionyl aminopeptidase